MTVEFATKWFLGCMAIFIVVFLSGVTFMWPPLPSNFGLCLLIGAVYGVVMIGPVIWYELTR